MALKILLLNICLFLCFNLPVAAGILDAESYNQEEQARKPALVKVTWRSSQSSRAYKVEANKVQIKSDKLVTFGCRDFDSKVKLIGHVAIQPLELKDFRLGSTIDCTSHSDNQ